MPHVYVRTATLCWFHKLCTQTIMDAMVQCIEREREREVREKGGGGGGEKENLYKWVGESITVEGGYMLHE